MMRPKKKALALTVPMAVIILVLLSLTRIAYAAETRGAKKVIRLEAIKVEGRIQKPQAFYILQRSNLNFEGLELKQSFLPKIEKSIEQAPF